MPKGVALVCQLGISDGSEAARKTSRDREFGPSTNANV